MDNVVRVAALKPHYYGGDRVAGEVYNCAVEHLHILVHRGLARIHPEVITELTPTREMLPYTDSVNVMPTVELPAEQPKKRRGRPPGSGVGHYTRKSPVID